MVARGMLRVWILKLISQGPKTGYGIIKEMQRKIGWQPSPGSVYPLLQMLREEGILEARPAGKKVYWELTPKGERYLNELREKRRQWLAELGIKEQAVWRVFDDPDHPLGLLPPLAHLAWRALSQGKGDEAFRVLREAKERLETLLEGS